MSSNADVAGISDRLRQLDQRLYAIHGRGHQSQAARAIGEDPNTVHQLLAPSRREVIRKLEEHVAEAESSAASAS